MKHYLNSIKAMILLLALAGLLMSCSQENKAPSLAKLGQPNISGYGNLGNCALDSMDSPGQGLRMAGSGLRMAGSGLRMAGSVGGLFIGQSGGELRGSSHPTDVAGYVDNLGDFSAKDSVGIIVLDKFSYADTEATYSLGLDVEELVYAAAAGEGTLKAHFERLRHNGQISHGALVLAHMHSILAASPSVSFSFMPDERTFVYDMGKHKHELVIRAVDVTNLNTAEMIEPLTQAVDYLADSGVTQYSVNMSFALVPCEILLEDSWNGSDSLEDYLAELESSGVDSDAFIADLSDSFVNEADPLVKFISADNSGEGHFVASSGNYDQSYPMYPALGRDVLSVGSHDLIKPKNGYLWNPNYSNSFSNAAEVVAPGWLFRLYDPITGVDVPEISYAGTSFASPAAAIYTAFDLAQKVPECHKGERSDLLNKSFKNYEMDYAILKECGYSLW